MASIEQINAFLAEPRNVMVAGIRKDGRPHLSPNWFHFDGERFYVSTTRSRVKYAIFRRDPRVELAERAGAHQHRSCSLQDQNYTPLLSRSITCTLTKHYLQL